jgi:hypothetical protein
MRGDNGLYREQLKRGFSRTVFLGVRRSYHQAIEKEEERLAIVLWVLMGWMEWIQFLGAHKQEACGSLAFEAEVDLEASVYLALSGFVKQALQVLRSWLELSLMGLWFSYNKEEFEKWMYHLRRAPFATSGFVGEKRLVDLISKSPKLKECEMKYHIVDRLLRLYDDLSASTHTRGYRSFETIARKRPVAAYNRENFAKWYKLFWATYSLVSAILFLRFPECYLRDRQEWDHIASGMMGSDLRMVEEICNARRGGG